MAELSAISPKQIDMFWDVVRPFIERAMETSAYDESSSVYDALKEERAQLWLVHSGMELEAVCVTQLSVTPKAKSCGIWIMTGFGRENWQHMLSEIENFARREGCTLMRHHARPGWQRILKPMGYDCTHVILEKAL